MVPLGLIDNKAALCYLFMRGLQDHAIIPVVSRVNENNSQTRLILPARTVESVQVIRSFFTDILVGVEELNKELVASGMQQREVVHRCAPWIQWLHHLCCRRWEAHHYFPFNPGIWHGGWAHSSKTWRCCGESIHNHSHKKESEGNPPWERFQLVRQEGMRSHLISFVCDTLHFSWAQLFEVWDSPTNQNNMKKIIFHPIS